MSLRYLHNLANSLWYADVSREAFRVIKPGRISGRYEEIRDLRLKTGMSLFDACEHLLKEDPPRVVISVRAAKAIGIEFVD